MWHQKYFLVISKQVVLLCGQTSFSLQKSPCQLKSWGFFTSQLGKIIEDMDNKTKRLWIRLSPEEEKLFREKASTYQSMSAMVRDAVRQFDDIATTGKIEALNEMIALYKKYQQDLSWLGGNFNQAMKRANELAIGDMLNKKYYEKVILPQCTRIMDLIAEIKSEQHEIARKLIKV